MKHRRLLKWCLIFVGWMLFGGFNASQALFISSYRDNPLVWWRVLSWDLAFCFLWFCLTPIVLWLSGRFTFDRGHRLKSLGAHVLGAVLLSVLHLIIYTSLDPLLPYFAVPDRVPRTSFSENLEFFVIGYMHVCLISYCGVVTINYLVRYYAAYQERSLRASQLEASLAMSRLETLKSQLHPHFLFNTLNAIVVLVRDKRNEEAEDMLTGLSELLRHSLENIGVQEVSLRQEIDFLKVYLEIEQIRFRDRLKVQLNIEPETFEASIPNLILQPLVENAIRHGIGKRQTAGLVAIAAERNNGTLRIAVRDDGPGLPNGRLDEESGLGIGLANTRARLRQLYGEGQSFYLQNAQGGGTIAVLEVPFRI